MILEKVDDVVYEVFNQYQRLLSHISPHDIFRAKHMVIGMRWGFFFSRALTLDS